MRPARLFVFLFAVLSITAPLHAQTDSLATEEEIPMKMPDEMPRFPGCEEMEGDVAEKLQCSQNKMLTYLYTNVRYPALARENGIEGVVVIQFIVEKDGYLSNIQIVREVGGGLAEEAARVVNLMNEEGLRWIPGKQEGEVVRVQFNLPVKFKLEGGKRKKSKKDRSKG